MLFSGKFTLLLNYKLYYSMEEELGPPCFKAVILETPHVDPKTQKILFKAIFRHSGHLIRAEVQDRALLDTQPGDEVYLSGNGEETCGIIHHNELVRWFMLFFG